MTSSEWLVASGECAERMTARKAEEELRVSVVSLAMANCKRAHAVPKLREPLPPSPRVLMQPFILKDLEKGSVQPFILKGLETERSVVSGQW